MLAVGAIGAGVGAAAGVASLRGLEPSRHSAPIDPLFGSSTVSAT